MKQATVITEQQIDKLVDKKVRKLLKEEMGMDYDTAMQSQKSETPLDDYKTITIQQVKGLIQQAYQLTGQSANQYLGMELREKKYFVEGAKTLRNKLLELLTDGNLGVTKKSYSTGERKAKPTPPPDRIIGHS